MSIQPYDTDHAHWLIDDLTDFGWSVYLHRFNGVRFVYHSDHNNTLEAERAADSIEWAEHPVEREPEQPIPLVGRAA